MLQQTTDGPKRHLTQPGIATASEQRFLIFPQRDMRMHSRPVVSIDRFRHEGYRLSILRRSIFDRIFIDHHFVGHRDQRVVVKVNFCLSRCADFMMLTFDIQTHLDHRLHHFITNIHHLVRRGNRKITFFVS